MTKRIRKLEQIEKLTEINGISLEELNRRCRPIDDNSSDAKWRFRSFEGFISQEEDLKGVLLNDWKIVCQEMGSSHEQIFSILDQIIRETEIKREKENFGPMKSIAITFPTQSFPQFFATDPSKREDSTQDLLIHKQIFNGDQYSPFWNESISKIDDKEVGDEDNLNVKWREEWIIENVYLGIKVKVAKGVLRFVKQLGFYEGGGHRNPYRINPILVASLSSGRVNAKVIKECEEQWKENWRVEEEERSELESELGKMQKDDEAVKWIEGRMSHLDKVIEEKRKEAQFTLKILQERFQYKS
eukprot:TRINITY_DN5048_c0_g1_i1.p2 TRINITY_DN5048_c0_g1~~TRINITY_DN5048_c0_g1_i1.p2  ORF type:complete len:301 (+),score=123.72 TRINITY_DN5048_c0_g1_i1:86-988(+)